MLEHKWELDLAGEWDLILEDGSQIPGKLPGCTYLALMESGRIEDPFYGANEQAAAKLAEQRYRYRRSFALTEAQLRQASVELVLDGVDTLAAVFVNGMLVGRTDNAFRGYRFAVKELLRAGENEIAIDFEPPHGFMREQQEKRPLAGMDIGIPGVSYLRKPQYHFGWDWGPSLPPAGVSGRLALESRFKGRLEKLVLSQKHDNGAVFLSVRAVCSETEQGLELAWSVTAPDGGTLERQAAFAGSCAEDTVQIQNPQLWWCNGMGGQPLYTVSAALRTASGETVDVVERRVGLRTVELNMDADQWGENFQFRINGEQIFAKGANWIPADSFIDRVTEEKLEFYIRSAQEANMNMLRVWGGGYYETDRFYELCDRFGILVWQDFAFACRAYPLDDPQFLNNVRAEVEDQVLRLHHHASLALWCGNNELQLEELLWARDRALTRTIHQFFFETLPQWIRGIDGSTPYWYGSPSDKEPGKRANGLSRGDTHLWQIWHGLMPVEGFRRYPTRFCSEFGLESLPSRNAVTAFTDVETAALESEDMLNHQKSARGNQKLLYYVTSRYHRPTDLDSTIYLTQIMQAEGIRSAVDFWRSSKGRCNGALYWQYNDCWPTVSWSGIDYLGQYKALQYLARDFYAPVSIVSEADGKRIKIQVVNDRAEPCHGALKWRSVCLDGTELASEIVELDVPKTGVSEVICLSYPAIAKRERPANVVLCLSLYEGQKETASRNQLLVKEQKIRFEKPEFKTRLELNGTRGTLTLWADRFAHYVELAVDGIVLNFSDNYFDLEKGVPKELHFELPAVMDKAELLRRLSIRSYADFPMIRTPGKDAWMRFRMRWSLQGIKGRIMTRV